MQCLVQIDGARNLSISLSSSHEQHCRVVDRCGGHPREKLLLVISACLGVQFGAHGSGRSAVVTIGPTRKARRIEASPDKAMRWAFDVCRTTVPSRVAIRFRRRRQIRKPHERMLQPCGLMMMAVSVQLRWGGTEVGVRGSAA